MLFVIFSPNRFVKANDHQSPVKVKVSNGGFDLPRQLTFNEFQRWLLNCRKYDKDMQVIIEPITILNPLSIHQNH
ncbi:hypothetical protein [Bacteroides heparinolyticus]|uniref:hypothetical protein n=1 Tax=Prevotella heparinolytica TaxID=28113 RepID=UPI0035A07597